MDGYILNLPIYREFKTYMYTMLQPHWYYGEHIIYTNTSTIELS